MRLARDPRCSRRIQKKEKRPRLLRAIDRVSMPPRPMAGLWTRSKSRRTEATCTAVSEHCKNITQCSRMACHACDPLMLQLPLVSNKVVGVVGTTAGLCCGKYINQGKPLRLARLRIEFEPSLICWVANIVDHCGNHRIPSGPSLCLHCHVKGDSLGITESGPHNHMFQKHRQSSWVCLQMENMMYPDKQVIPDYAEDDVVKRWFIC